MATSDIGERTGRASLELHAVDPTGRATDPQGVVHAVTFVPSPAPHAAQRWMLCRPDTPVTPDVEAGRITCAECLRDLLNGL